MSRYRGPKLRITRRLGNLPGLTQKNQKKLIDQDNMEKIMGKILKRLRNMDYD